MTHELNLSVEPTVFSLSPVTGTSPRSMGLSLAGSAGAATLGMITTRCFGLTALKTQPPSRPTTMPTAASGMIRRSPPLAGAGGGRLRDGAMEDVAVPSSVRWLAGNGGG